MSTERDLSEFLDALTDAVTAIKNRPRTPDEYQATNDDPQSVWQATIDGTTCSGCGGIDGFVVRVGQAVGDDSLLTKENRIMVCAFEHDQGASIVLMSAEQAKQLVNRMGEAISVAERVDAGTFTRKESH